MDSERTPRRLARRLGFDPDYLEAFEEKMFGVGQRTDRRLTNFFSLLLLATVIATFGVIADSTATVIGAMIIAPLMGPIMATAAAIVMGSATRAARALALVAAGSVAAVALSYALSWISPAITIGFAENTEITARVSPGILALLTALASGAAGAIISSREEIADSMGGVAIAISLVPPLCVIGIAIRLGEFTAALGALMLFLTNIFAILLAGGIVFLIGGLGRLALREESQRMRSSSFALVILSTCLVAIPLGITSWRSINRSIETNAASIVVTEWLEGTDYTTVAVTVGDPEVNAQIAGSGPLRPLSDLANQLATLLERRVALRLSVIPSQYSESFVEMATP